MTVVRPPADAAELAEFPAKQIDATFPHARIHHHAYEPEWFCTCGKCRFDPRESSSFGTCYVAAHPLGAFVEKFGRLRIVPRSIVDQHALSDLYVASPIRVADLTNRTVLGRWGLTAEIWAGDDYDGSQRWAERLQQAGFSGIWYTARHDIASDLHSLALFGKTGYQPDELICINSVPVPELLIESAYDAFRIEVL